MGRRPHLGSGSFEGRAETGLPMRGNERSLRTSARGGVRAGPRLCDAVEGREQHPGEDSAATVIAREAPVAPGPRRLLPWSVLPSQRGPPELSPFSTLGTVLAGGTCPAGPHPGWGEGDQRSWLHAEAVGHTDQNVISRALESQDPLQILPAGDRVDST